jgi:DNA-binding transcriptional regulator YhcF (GntR family)
MDIVLSRRGGGPVRDQIVTQLQMKILDGTLAQGQRLPSVRALARRLKVHHNTISAAYQDLEAAGHVELQRGSGVFVRRAGAATLAEAGGLDEMIRLALRSAVTRGFSPADIRAAVRRWLETAPAERVLVVDPSLPTAELLAHEIGRALTVPVMACSLEALAARPALAEGALIAALPYHRAAIRHAVPGAAAAVLTRQVAADDRRAIETAAPGSIVLVVSHAPEVLPFASVFLRSLRGEDLIVEALRLSAPAKWKRLVKAADLVLADALSAETVRKAGPRHLREFRVVPEMALSRLRKVLDSDGTTG